MQVQGCRPSRLLLPLWLILVGPVQGSEPVAATDSATDLLEFLGALEADGWRQWTEFFDSLPEGLDELPADTGRSGVDEGENL